jgi:hypothetical protein
MEAEGYFIEHHNDRLRLPLTLEILLYTNEILVSLVGTIILKKRSERVPRLKLELFVTI